MTKPSYKVVLSDKLFSIYKRASVSSPLSTKERKAYDLLMGNVELDILTNAAQVQRCKDSHNLPNEVYTDLYPTLLSLDDQKDLSLEDLSKITLFKLIVTQTEGDVNPPYFNLKKQYIKRNYTISSLHDEDREPLKSYLACILENADTVLIHDKYFSKEVDNKKLFEVLPDKDIVIQYIENADASNGDFVRGGCASNRKWKVERCDTTKIEFNRFARSHDRYLVVNGNLELTLTSGFFYLWNKEKEITCVVREL